MSGPGPQVALAAGKLMIAGEYAVLGPEGASLSVAVGQLARARAAPAAARPAMRTLRAFDTAWRWQHGGDVPAGLAARIEQALAIPALRDAAAAHDIDLDVGGHAGGAKLGLGTSAAAMVAVTRALVVASGHTPQPDPGTLLGWLQHAHQAGQRGRGSGYDLATILHGGVIRYTRRTRAVERLSWPTGIAAAALFSGTPADTSSRLGSVESLSPAALRQIAAAEAAVAAGWRRGDVGDVLDALQRAEGAFDNLAAGVEGMQTACMDHAREVIRAAGAIARTSGAGGGDCVLGFGTPDQVDRLAATWRARGGLVAAHLPSDIAAIANEEPDDGTR